MIGHIVDMVYGDAMNSRESRRRRPFGALAPWPLRFGLGALLVEASALVVGGGVLVWGGVSAGGLADMIALGLFFVVTGVVLGLCAVALERGVGRVRGIVVTIQLLVGLGIVTVPGIFPAPFVVLAAVLAIVAVVGVLAPTSRAYLER